MEKEYTEEESEAFRKWFQEGEKEAAKLGYTTVGPAPKKRTKYSTTFQKKETAASKTTRDHTGYAPGAASKHLKGE